ncbi:MAG: hypothetical protein NC328_07225, partial [Muribaculum sp.]|nr:hypothetical protein [Muribaculum sp.]
IYKYVNQKITKIYLSNIRRLAFLGGRYLWCRFPWIIANMAGDFWNFFWNILSGRKLFVFLRADYIQLVVVSAAEMTLAVKKQCLQRQELYYSIN